MSIQKPKYIWGKYDANDPSGQWLPTGDIPDFAQDQAGNVVGLVGPSGSDFLVVSSSAPNNADGRPDGTIYIQTA